MVSTLWEPEVWKREEIIAQFGLELLVLALCHPGLFNITSVVESKPGWGCFEANVSNLGPDASWVSYDSPGRDSDRWGEWAEKFYGIWDSDWNSFKRLLDLIHDAVISCVRSKAWDFEALLAAASWYLRGRFMEHPQLNNPDEHQYKDLLHYVTCLENLLMLPGEDGIADKLSSRGAWIAGRNDSDRVSISAFLKQVYNARSRTVHRPSKT